VLPPGLNGLGLGDGIVNSGLWISKPWIRVIPHIFPCFSPLCVSYSPKTRGSKNDHCAFWFIYLAEDRSPLFSCCYYHRTERKGCRWLTSYRPLLLRQWCCTARKSTIHLFTKVSPYILGVPERMQSALYRAFQKHVPIRLLGTRFTNAISCFEPGSQEP
jgi:hypothetical protein